MGELELEGVILDAGYLLRGNRGIIRLTLKTRDKAYNLLDPSFYPYFYLVPSYEKQGKTPLEGMTAVSKENEEIKVKSIEEDKLIVGRDEKRALKVYLYSPRHVPKMSEVFGEFGTCYESDIVFWNKKVCPLLLTF